MKRSNYLPVPGVYHVHAIFLVLTCMVFSCQDSPNSPSVISEEPAIREEIPPQIQHKADTASVDSSFIIFDGTDLKEYSEELGQAGLTPIHIAYQVHLWGKTHNELKQTSPWELPPQDRLVEQARKAEATNSEMAIIDIEHWPVESSEEQKERSLQNYITVYERFKQAQPDLKVGYYDLVPHKNWYAEKPQHILDKWRSSNDFLAPLAQKVDAFFPNLYTYNKDREYWVESAKLLLEEARRMGGDKPVYAFIWPQYWAAHDESLRGVYIDAEFWRLQLQTVRKYADGAVIWFPYNVDDEEAFRAPWLEVTKNFL